MLRTLKISNSGGLKNLHRIFGYGEDTFTLWALRHRKSEILKEFQDKTSPSDCLVFYRPSFGRGDGAEFGDSVAIESLNKTIGKQVMFEVSYILRIKGELHT